MASGRCKVDGCEGAVKARGWCQRHYWYAWRHGTPEKPTPEELFWSHVDRSAGPGGCWPWTGYRTDRGYGVWRQGNQIVKAHRVAYELTVGPIPDGFEPDHTCHSSTACSLGDACPHRACCNPGDMELVTHRENCRRSRALRRDVDGDEVERLWIAGHGKRAIGILLGCSWGPVVRIARERNLPPHPAGGRRP